MNAELVERVRVSDIMERCAPSAVFVFGSNEDGVHGAGAALTARRYYGAIVGVGEGFRGSSYAIPTKDRDLCPLDIAQMVPYVRRFVAFARQHPELQFAVTRVGCGLAGNTDAQMAPMFAGAPDNCHLPTGWRDLCLSEG